MTPASTPRLFCFGLGYSATVLARQLLSDGWHVSGTCRDEQARANLKGIGIDGYLFDRAHPLSDIDALLSRTTHLLSSVPPDDHGDAVLDGHGDAIARHARNLTWAGYLSTTGVYGNTNGAWVDETSPCQPTQRRSIRRLAAEQKWMALHPSAGLPIHAFRLAGIYGPGSSALDKVRQGRTDRTDKPGHKFGRIHVDDIAQTLKASMGRPNPGTIYNVTDDEPAEPSTVTAFACQLLGIDVADAVPYAVAEKNMSPMQRTFWADDRLVDNTRLHKDLGVTLKYPTYREGLAAIAKAER